MAYDIGYDIVVEDDNIKAVKGNITRKSEKVEKLISDFESILKDITNKAVKEGEFRDKIILFTQQITKLKGDTNKTTKDIKDEIDNFLKDFDTADNYLYYSE